MKDYTLFSLLSHYQKPCTDYAFTFREFHVENYGYFAITYRKFPVSLDVPPPSLECILEITRKGKRDKLRIKYNPEAATADILEHLDSRTETGEYNYESDFFNDVEILEDYARDFLLYALNHSPDARPFLGPLVIDKLYKIHKV